MANVYLDALLWLTPTRPSFLPVNNAGQTVVTYAFGGPGTCAVYDPESTVDRVTATAWQSYEQQAAVTALQAWADVANISIKPAQSFSSATWHLLTTNEAGMQAYFSGEKGVQAMSTLPNNYGPNYGEAEPNYTPGWSIFNTQGYGWTKAGLVPGGEGYVTLVHEIGHLLGLDHPWNEKGWYVDASGAPLLDASGNKIPEPYFPGANAWNNTGDYGLNQGIFTTMGYTDGWNGQPAKGTDYGYQKGPGAFDIAAVQQLYGPNLTSHTGDDTYLLPTVNKSGTGWSAIWDAGGTDTISAANATGSATIDLRPATLDPAGGPGAGGYVSWVQGIQGGFTIANPNGVATAVVENAVGGAYADTINGNEAANTLTGNAGNDTLNGYGGQDRIVGGLGADVMTGGASADTFVFTQAAESTPGSKTHDVITDFSPGVDQIDLTGLGVHTWIGSAQFDHGAGEVRYAAGLLQADLNGDGKADFEVALQNSVALQQQHDVLLA
ncbi:M10 family metallopeptidase [Methylobacterium nigriterrae]|uniref:M10 family metallopeptidase n=1 Tax=Methylobacterium nigriterrae TaxID=3127512 RepID=UPI003013D87A